MPLRLIRLDVPDSRADCSARAGAHRLLTGAHVALWPVLFVVCCAKARNGM